MAKRGRRPRSRPVDWSEFGDAVVGSGWDGDVSVVVRDEGGAREAIFLPRGITRLGEEGFEIAHELQHITGALRIGTERLEAAVRDARALGLSWDSIGFCVGTTGEAARQRWGVVADE